METALSSLPKTFTMEMPPDKSFRQCTMKRLVRHRTTRAYLDRNGGWTRDGNELEHFESIQAILAVQRRFQLRDIEVVLQMGEEPSAEYDVALPINELPRA